MLMATLDLRLLGADPADDVPDPPLPGGGRRAGQEVAAVGEGQVIQVGDAGQGLVERPLSGVLPASVAQNAPP